MAKQNNDPEPSGNSENITSRFSFAGARVASFESRQQAGMEQLIRKFGGVPFVSPSMQERPVDSDARRPLFAFAQSLLTGNIDTVIAMTGVGFRYLIEALGERFDRQQILDFLSDITTITRGPKPTAAMHQMGVSASYKVGHPHTWRDILTLIDQHALATNRSIAVLEYGETNPSLIAGLEARGANVMAVSIYQWQLPDDLAPLQHNIRRIIDRQIDLSLFTSAQQVVHLFEVAQQMGLRDPLHDRLQQTIIASIGPTTTERLHDWELPAYLEPEQGKMARLVSASAEYWAKYGAMGRRSGNPNSIRLFPGKGRPIAFPVPSQPTQSARQAKAQSTRQAKGQSTRQAKDQAAAVQPDNSLRAYAEPADEPAVVIPPLDQSLILDRDATQAIAAQFTTQAWYNGPFLKACRREPCDVTPVWLMRQAGRYMQEYQEVRAKLSFLELCKNSQLCSEVMCTAVSRLGVDAAIIFSDLLPILEPMGFELTFGPGHGPQIHNPIRSVADVQRVQELEDMSALEFVPRTVEFTRRDIAANIPVIGFAGSPFTLASYCIEGSGSRNYINTKRLMYSHPQAWSELMQKLTHSIARYLNAQIRAGAGCVQLFDSWVGTLSPSDYQHYVLPWMVQLLRALPSNVPVINFGTGNPQLLPLYAAAEPDVVGVDWRIELDQAWEMIGPDFAVQGNLDPLVLLSDLDVIRGQVRRILRQAGGRPGHIFNLGHGIVPETPVDHAVALVDMVHEYSN